MKEVKGNKEEEESEVHCQEKAHEHSRKRRSQSHPSLHLLPSVSDPPTSTCTSFLNKITHTYTHKKKKKKTIKPKERQKWEALLYLRSASWVMYRARK